MRAPGRGTLSTLLFTQVEELQGMMPELTSEEATTALDLCNGNEDDAAAQLTSDPSFLRHVRATLHGAVVAERPRSSSTAPVGPRPKRVDLSKLGDGVFVGSFRGKGYENHQQQQQRRAVADAAAAADVQAEEPCTGEGDAAQEQQQQDFTSEATEQEEAEQEATATTAEPVVEQQADEVEGAAQGTPAPQQEESKPSRPSRGDDPEATATAILAQVCCR